MKVAKHLYLGTLAAGKQEQLLLELEQGQGKSGFYAILPSRSPDDLLDMVPLEHLPELAGDLYIVGFAGSREEAAEVCRDIVLDVYQKTGQYHVREYCLHQMEYI